jgi:membrane-associated phospholipid phosphatase
MHRPGDNARHEINGETCSLVRARAMTIRFLPGALILCCVLAIIAAGAFLAFPQLDLAVTHAFYDRNHAFYGTTLFGRALRAILRLASYAVFAAFVLAYISARLYARKRLVPTGRNLAFLALTLALGPGLSVNLLIKEHSHRPRPFQTQAFGGQWEFRPFGHFDGQCVTDCSFVSGETSTAAWSLAPALLTPPAWRATLIGASLLFTLVMGVERVAYGGHYLSDVTFGALLNWFVVLAAAMLMRIRPPG